METIRQPLFLLIFIILTGCASTQQRDAYKAYEARIRGTMTEVSRVRFTVPQGSVLTGGFELVVSDPAGDVGAYVPPDTTGQTVAKEVGSTTRAVAPLAVAGYIAGRPATVARPEVVRPEVIQLPAPVAP